MGWRNVAAIFLEPIPTEGHVESQSMWDVHWRPRRRSCVVCLLLQALLVGVGFCLLVPHTRDPEIFAPSRPVGDAGEALELTAGLRAWLLQGLRHHDRVCGIAAANFRDYRQYLMLRTNYQELFNPRVVRVIKERNRDVELQETSLMCRDSPPQTRRRQTAVEVEYEDAAFLTHRHAFFGRDAICVEHFIEVFGGHWPCRMSVVDAVRRPQPPLPQRPDGSFGLQPDGGVRPAGAPPIGLAEPPPQLAPEKGLGGG